MRTMLRRCCTAVGRRCTHLQHRPSSAVYGSYCHARALLLRHHSTASTSHHPSDDVTPLALRHHSTASTSHLRLGDVTRLALRHHSTASTSHHQSDDVTPLVRQISARIRASGAMTVAELMSEALNNPTAGYYQLHADIGPAGDFITAPELTPVFGELLGVWLLHEWQKLGSPSPFQLVELGPGRGSLISDVLGVWHRLVPDVPLEVHLVENSPGMVARQAAALGAVRLNMSLHQNPVSSEGGADSSAVRPEICDELVGVSRHGYSVHWHSLLQDVPRQFTLLLASEFLDTMPSHQFRKTKHGWREVLVDVDPENSLAFRFVLAPACTPALLLIEDDVDGDMTELEISPRCDVWVGLLARRIAEDGGVALFVDYGSDKQLPSSSAGDTLRAFRGHRCVDPLISLGRADLTCDVNFGRLKRVAAREAGAPVITYGPVQQRHFLAQMGLQHRLQALVDADPSIEQQLKGVYRTLMEDMGECFKMLAMYPEAADAVLRLSPPPGFNTEQFP